MIISVVSLVYLRFTDIPLLDYQLLPYDVYNTQLQAMIEQSDVYLEQKDNGCSYPTHIYFNHKGNINQATTVICPNHKFTLQLGMGRVFYE